MGVGCWLLHLGWLGLVDFRKKSVRSCISKFNLTVSSVEI